MRSRGIFVTGTDTGVGKSVIAGALAGVLIQQGIDTGVMKPIQTGATKTSSGWIAPDAEYLKRVSGVDDPIELICPLIYETPASPMVAALMEERPIDLGLLYKAYRSLSASHEFMVVEGAGGLSVPIGSDYLMSDLAMAMRLPIVIVARPSLGTINHTYLTVEHARKQGLTISGIIINNYPENPDIVEETNPSIIEQVCSVPILACIHNDPELQTGDSYPQNIMHELITAQVIDALSEKQIIY